MDPERAGSADRLRERQNERLNDRLLGVALEFGTPAYVYDADLAVARVQTLERLFHGRFRISYAVKANPNLALLRALEPHVATFDVSAWGEVERVLEIGCPPGRITFSGPAKRPAELSNAVHARIGELVLESVAEAETADRAAREAGLRQRVLIRLNPAARPRRVGVSFSGRPSQFGIDEEAMDEAIDRVTSLPGLELAGFHIFSGVNGLDAASVAENFAISAALFRKAAARAGAPVRKLVFGSGFGLPYGPADRPLDVEAVAEAVLPEIDALMAEPSLSGAELALELGRWIVGPAGWLLTSVVAAKHSRGVEFRACDAGFNNHLAACGMMGTVIRRNWRFANLSNPGGPEGRYTLVGPLCTSIDVLATDLALPEARVGDVIAVENSGAYGLTASPTRFISHPEPAEVLLMGDRAIDVTERALPRRSGRPLSAEAAREPAE